MKVTTSSVGGRAPPRRKSPLPAGCRWPAAGRGSPCAARVSSLALLGREPGPHAGVDLGLLHPEPERLGRRHRADERPGVTTPWSPGSSRRRSRTIRTARSFSSGGYRFDDGFLLMLHPRFQGMEHSRIPGRFNPFRNGGGARTDIRTGSKLGYREADEVVAWAVAARAEIHLALVVRRQGALCRGLRHVHGVALGEPTCPLGSGRRS